MRPHRAITIAVFVVLQVTAGAQKRVIVVNPQANLFAAPGDYLEWRKATPQTPDFVVFFPPGQSPCRETSISVNGNKPSRCKVVVPAAGDFGYYPYDIYINLPGTIKAPEIKKPTTWPSRIPFQVSKCGVCGSAVVTQGSIAAGSAAPVSQTQGGITATVSDKGSSAAGTQVSTSAAEAKPKLQATANDSDTGYISCDPDNNNITRVTDLNVLLSDQQINWIQAGTNNWKIDTFTPSSPCTKDTITSGFRVCFLSASAPGDYTYYVTAAACSGRGTGKLSIK